MLERNRTFGRVSRPVDKAAAPRQALERQRKAGRAKHAAMVQPKPQATRFRELPNAQATAASPTVLPGEAPARSVIAADSGPPAAPVSDAAFIEKVTVAEAVAPIETAEERPTGPTDRFSHAPDIVIQAAEAAAPVLSVTMDPSARPTPPMPRRAAKRRPVLRLAVAASVALACLLTFGRFSDAHLSAPPTLSLAPPVASTEGAATVGQVLPQVAAFTLPPADVAILPPLFATIARGTDDLVETATLPPSATERVTARVAAIPEKADAPTGHAGAPRKPATAKQVVSRSAAPRARIEPTRQQRSRGPILDFLSDLIP